MEPNSLENRAKTLAVKLTDDCEESGRGSMSPSVYDTAWVSLIQKSNERSREWLFPECFLYVVNHQLEDGSWASYASEIDGILNTAASLLSLQRHSSDVQQWHDTQDLSIRIKRANMALKVILEGWDVESTVHVGFEILVPALLDYLAEEGFHFEFPGKSLLYELNARKLSNFKPEYLYSKAKLTALHSLEAFIGKIDFDRIQHHKVGGSFMASPSSTAAYLMTTSTWNDDCESYLREVLARSAGNATGGVPSAFPSTIFEMTWIEGSIYTARRWLRLNRIAPTAISESVKFLSAALKDEPGLVGFTPLVGVDADDTAKTILTLNLLGHSTSADSLIREFEAKDHFKTYPHERDPSFSANCNVLICLLHTDEPSKYAPQIDKATRFLYGVFHDLVGGIKDKWNISRFYPHMLMMQASVRLFNLWASGRLPTFDADLIERMLLPVLSQFTLDTLHSQGSNGSWGCRQLEEETAYAILVLVYAAQLPFLYHLRPELYASIKNGRDSLRSSKVPSLEYLWVEKVTYASEVLSESYVLAALNYTVPPPCCNLTLPDEAMRSRPSNGVPSPIDAVKASERKTLLNHTNVGTDSKDVTDASIKVVNGTDSPDASKSTGSSASTNHENGVSKATLDTGSSRKDHAECLGAENEHLLLGPFNYLEQHPGKDIRTQFLRAFNSWLQVPPAKLAIITNIIKMLHTASLLIDDIEDCSHLRRGIPVAHSIFGVAQTFNSSNYVYFLALQETAKLGCKAMMIFTTELLNLHRGQGMDIYWREALVCPTQNEYLQMVSNKTGGLFRLAIKLMQAESQQDPLDCEELVDLMSKIFQVRDDYMNLSSYTYAQNKGFCEDLSEGKFSFPIIHSIRADPTNIELLNILKQRTSEKHVKIYALAIMERTGSIAYTRDYIKDLQSKAKTLIESYEIQGRGRAEGVRKVLDMMDVD